MPKRSILLILAAAICLLTAPAVGIAQTAAPEDSPATQLALSGNATDTRSLEPVTPEALRRGIEFLKDGSYEEAVAELTKARESDPASAQTAYSLGLAWKKSENYTEALKYFTDAVSLPSPVREAYLEQADLYLRLDRIEEALQALRNAERSGVEPAQTAFLKGLALMKQEKYTEAVDSFTTAQTGDARLKAPADYQIASILFQQGKLAEARDLFRTVAARDQNTDLASFADRYMEAISRKMKETRSYKFAARLAYQLDDNVILNPPGESPPADISGQSDTAVVLKLSADYATARGSLIRYSLVNTTYGALTSYDTMNHEIWAAVPLVRANDGELTVHAVLDYTLKDMEKYLTTLTFSGGYLHAPTEAQTLNFVVRIKKKTYAALPSDANDNRDADELSAGVLWTLYRQHGGFLGFSYDRIQESAVGNNWSYAGDKLGCVYVRSLTEKLRAMASIKAFFQNYDNANTHDPGVLRADKTYMFFLQARYALTGNIDAGLEYSMTKNDSNIDIANVQVYDYSKTIMAAGLEWRF